MALFSLVHDRGRPWSFYLRNARDVLSTRDRMALRLALVARGFSANQIVMHNLLEQDFRGFPPDLLKLPGATNNTNRGVWPILHDKLMFDSVVGRHLTISPLLALCANGAVTPLIEHVAVDGWLHALIEAHPLLVIKPLQGGEGRGITFARCDGQQVVLRTVGQAEECMAVDTFAMWLRSREYHGIFRHETQHPDVASFHPQTSNTVRVLVYRARDGRGRIFMPVLRVGTSRSAPVDNVNAGGIIVAVDVQTGITTCAAMRLQDGSVVSIDHHPETGVPLLARQLPMWREAVRMLLEFHGRFPQFDCVGWDVLLRPEGPVVLEGNHNPDLFVHFRFATLLQDDEFRQFCVDRGLIPSAWFDVKRSSSR